MIVSINWKSSCFIFLVNIEHEDELQILKDIKNSCIRILWMENTAHF